MTSRQSAAGFGVTFEFGLDPIGGGVDAGAGRKIGVHAGEGAAVVEADEFGDDGFDVIGRDLLEGAGDGGIGGSRGDGLAGGAGFGSGFLRLKEAKR